MSQVDPTLKARDDGPLVHHDGFGGLVRRGGWDEQAISTFRLAAQAFEDGRFEDASDLARYTVEEAVEGHEIYGMGIESVPEYMRAHGVDDAVIEDGNKFFRNEPNNVAAGSPPSPPPPGPPPSLPPPSLPPPSSPPPSSPPRSANPGTSAPGPAVPA